MFVPLTPVRCLHRAVDVFPDKTGVVCGADQFTYAQFGERCERLATGLSASGVEPGDRVAFLSFNNHQLLEGYFGVPQARAIVMPLNVRLSAPELIGILRHCRGKRAHLRRRLRWAGGTDSSEVPFHPPLRVHQRENARRRFDL